MVQNVTVVPEVISKKSRTRTPDQLKPPPELERQDTPQTVQPSHSESETVLLHIKPAPALSNIQQTSLSPPQHRKIATILAKSPHRQTYRVGLSRRVNI